VGAVSERVRLDDGVTARVVVAPLTITALQVPAVVTRARVADRLVAQTTAATLPRLVGKATLPVGTGEPPDSTGGLLTYVQRFPLLVWRFTHPLGRRPMVNVFYGLDDDAESADTDVRASALEVVVEWAEPTVGSVVLR
jgi:hypothetical protein